MFFIPLNVPSLKNGKQITKFGLIPNKRVRAYAKEVKQHIAKIQTDFTQEIASLSPPYVVGFRFVRDSKRKFDYSNALDTIQDVLTGCLIKNTSIKVKELQKDVVLLFDDNADILLPVLLPYKYDKHNSGVEIHIFKCSADEYEKACLAYR